MEFTTHDLSGTRIHATLRAEDLIPAFLNAADAAIEYWRTNWRERFADELESCGTIDAWDTTLGELERAALRLKVDKYPGRIDGTYADQEAAGYVVESLFDLLDDLAPEGHYFGATEGDGSDFGFWQSDDDGD